jgi:hypothetical protein
MSSAVRIYMSSILVCIGLAGCTPAHFVQRPRLAEACQVKVCTNPGTGVERCECKTHDQVLQQTRHSFWPHVE